AFAVVMTLALGIGANAAMFSVVDALLLRPLPYDRPAELVDVHAVRRAGEWSVPLVPYAVARGWQNDRAEVVLHSRADALFTGGTEPRTITVQGVTPEFGDVFGVAPMLGRAFDAADAEPAAPDVVLLDHAFWQTELGGDRNVVGRTIELSGIAHTVIGVMPEGFRFPTYASTAGWVALRSDGGMLGRTLSGRIEATMRVA